MTKIQKLKTYFISALVVLVLPQMVFAAQIFFESKTTQIQIGGKIEVNLFVNTEQESINAFEGNIAFPADILDLKEIRDGNTVVNFWIDPVRNCVSNGVEKPDSICFSGITPGGFNGGKGLIFSAIFEAKQEGIAKFEINDARVLRNDGTGSAATLTVTPFEIAVFSGVSAEIPTLPEVKDHEPPESFAPEIAKDESIFDGERFVVFVTQDKASGIEHYEIKESRQKFFAILKKWLPAESPHVLTDQELRSFVWIKAVDKAGNQRITEIPPQNPLRWYENYENWIIIVIGILILCLSGKMLWRKKNLGISK